MSGNSPYEFLPHTADIKIRAYGTDLDTLFQHSMAALFAACGPQKVEPKVYKERRVVLESSQVAYLLIDFLSECLYLSDAYNETYDTVVFSELSETSLVAELQGCLINGYAITEIKAVTYHDVSVERVNGMWQATFVLDI